MDLVHTFVEYFTFLVKFVLKIDRYLESFIQDYGNTTYVILFAIVFVETGLVILPFLPGDSLLFAAGALCSRGMLDIKVLIPLLIVAAVLGDALNYMIGRYFGKTLFEGNYRWFKKEYVERSNAFYEKYGTKTIVFCRFVPIVRTFAPFIAGFGKMSYKEFSIYNIVGAFLWVVSFASAGYFFGNLPIVRESLTMLILGIIFLSFLPIIWEICKARKPRTR